MYMNILKTDPDNTNIIKYILFILYKLYNNQSARGTGCSIPQSLFREIIYIATTTELPPCKVRLLYRHLPRPVVQQNASLCEEKCTTVLFPRYTVNTLMLTLTLATNDDVGLSRTVHILCFSLFHSLTSS